MSDLKPCPVFNAFGTEATYGPDLHMLSVRRVFNQRLAVRCECGVLGPSHITEAGAIAAWNTRPGDAVLKLAQEVADFGRTRRVEFLSTDLPEIQRMVFKFAELLPDGVKPNAAV